MREGDKEVDRFPVKLDLQVPLAQTNNLVSSVLKTQFNKKIHGVKSGGSPITTYYRKDFFLFSILGVRLLIAVRQRLFIEIENKKPP